MLIQLPYLSSESIDMVAQLPYLISGSIDMVQLPYLSSGSQMVSINLVPETDITAQFLGLKTDIMGKRYSVDPMQNFRTLEQHLLGEK